MFRKTVWDYIDRIVNGNGSAFLNLYSAANCCRNNRSKAKHDLFSTLKLLNSLPVDNPIIVAFSATDSGLQLLVDGQRAYDELRLSDSLKQETMHRLAKASMKSIGYELPDQAATLAVSIGITVGVYSLFEDNAKWSYMLRVWLSTSKVFNYIVESLSGKIDEDIFEHTNAIAVAQLLKNIDSFMDNDCVENIFNLVSVSNFGPETILNIIGDILGIGKPVLFGDTDAFYTRLATINNTIFTDVHSETLCLSSEYQNMRVVSTSSLSSSAQSSCVNGVSYRYALANLNVIAITGNCGLYEKHNRNCELAACNYSEETLCMCANIVEHSTTSADLMMDLHRKYIDQEDTDYLVA